MALLVCEQCKSEGSQTLIPYDPIGIALMHQHLKSHDPAYTPPPPPPPSPADQDLSTERRTAQTLDQPE